MSIIIKTRSDRNRLTKFAILKIPKIYNQNEKYNIKVNLPESERELYDWTRCMLNGEHGLYYQISGFVDDNLFKIIDTLCFEKRNSIRPSSELYTCVNFIFPFGNYFVDNTLFHKIEKRSLPKNISELNFRKSKSDLFFNGTILCNGTVKIIDSDVNKIIKYEEEYEDEEDEEIYEDYEDDDEV